MMKFWCLHSYHNYTIIVGRRHYFLADAQCLVIWKNFVKIGILLAKGRVKLKLNYPKAVSNLPTFSQTWPAKPILHLNDFDYIVIHRS